LGLRDLGLHRAEFLPQLGHALHLPFSILRDMARPWTRKIMGLYFLVVSAWSLLMLLSGDASLALQGFAVFTLLAFGFASADDELGRRVLPLSRRVTAGVLGLLLLAWFVVIPLERAIPGLIWIVGFSALGEELFFRGYVQSRCNQLYGRPWSIGSTRYGPGIYVAAALFGTVHLINPWNYFTGSGSLAWDAPEA
jgi:membrane protease YdiL (CAAX protease family)